MLPYLDGERTPNLPLASGTIRGLRHTSTPQQILMAAYEGAVASLLVAFDAIGEAVGGLDPAAPLLLIGGGARGRTWRSVVGRLTGRAIQVPEAGELVAIGAAVQADGRPARRGARREVAARWDGAAASCSIRCRSTQDRLARIRELLADVTAEQEAVPRAALTRRRAERRADRRDTMSACRPFTWIVRPRGAFGPPPTTPQEHAEDGSGTLGRRPDRLRTTADRG